NFSRADVVEFGMRIGALTSVHDKKQSKAVNLDKIEKFIIDKAVSRQHHAKRLALAYLINANAHLEQSDNKENLNNNFKEIFDDSSPIVLVIEKIERLGKKIKPLEQFLDETQRNYLEKYKCALASSLNACIADDTEDNQQIKAVERAVIEMENVLSM